MYNCPNNNNKRRTGITRPDEDRANSPYNGGYYHGPRPGNWWW